jgi:hypothetical protein
LRILPAFALSLLSSPAMAEGTEIALALRFDPETAARLAELGEKVVVSAYYFGDPAAGNTLPLDDMGQVVLTEEEITVTPEDQTVTLGAALAAAPLESVPHPRINVNVFSARLADPNNLLWCGILDATVADAAAGEPAIACQLIGG